MTMSGRYLMGSAVLDDYQVISPVTIKLSRAVATSRTFIAYSDHDLIVMSHGVDFLVSRGKQRVKEQHD